MAGYCIVLTTCGGRAEAEQLADRLVEGRLAACVQLVAIESRYLWKGEVAREPEVLVLAKTRDGLFERASAAIRETHSYEVPEIVRIPIDAGLPAYLGWIDEVTRGDDDRAPPHAGPE